MTLRYPAQSDESFKIPSVIIYTKDGKVRAVGAEAVAPCMLEELEDEDKGLRLVEWCAVFGCCFRTL